MCPQHQRTGRRAILLESREVERQIKALRIKAERLGELIVEFGTTLKRRPAAEIIREDQAHYDLATLPTPPEILAAMRGWQESFEIADQLRQAISRARELAQQRARLGLK